MISKFLKITGILAIIILVFIFGYAVGKTPTTTELTTQASELKYHTDLLSLSDIYGKLFGLCEDKYQAASKGNMAYAYQLKGEMDILQAQVNAIMKNYATN